MSVNTPKRPKTAYLPSCGYTDENSEALRDSNHVDYYLPSAWSWTPGLTAGYEEPMCPNAVLSPSSCGSPDPVRTPIITTTPRTPSNSSAGQSSIPAAFPTPTTSSMLAGGEAMSSSGGRSEHNKRGRPRSESLTNLMIEGSTSPSSIKCKFCHRVFPREKSLAAHLRTHTGERPYVCDYPGCTKSFTQSGQMKTHQRLHTGERPFICAVPNCEQRFTHANRHCPVHVHSQLKRDDKFVVKMTPEQNEEVLRWLEKYRAEREDKSTPPRKTPQRNGSRATTPGSGKGRSLSASAEKKENLPQTPQQAHKTANDNQIVGVENDGDLNSSATKRHHNHHHRNDENECPDTPSTPSSNPYKSRKGLMVELDMNAGLAFSPLAPLKMKPQPKVIQWQEPLSQGEEDDDEDDDDEEEDDEENRSPQNGGGSGARRYLTINENHPKEALNSRVYFSPSKRAQRLNTASTFNPKKKWLREACMEDLARPLEASNNALGSPQKLQIKSLNQLRPTVLMLASSKEKPPTPLLNGGDNRTMGSNGTAVPDGAQSVVVVAAPPAETHNRKWLGAMALMQLATEEGATNRNGNLNGAEGVVVPSQPLTVINGGGSGDGFNGAQMPEYTQL